MTIQIQTDSGSTVTIDTSKCKDNVAYAHAILLALQIDANTEYTVKEIINNLNKIIENQR